MEVLYFDYHFRRHYLFQYFHRRSLTSLKWLRLLVWLGTLTQTRMGIGKVTFSSRGLYLAYGKYPKYQDLPSGHDGVKTILHMYWCGTRKFHPRTGRIRQKWGFVEFLMKLFRFEGEISLSHTNTFSRPLCDFLRIFGVTNEFSRWKTGVNRV